ncbi:hypothetical protein RHECNPAF_2530044 [Rhizobium etli CNPAF512]|nr:hypothetical protein RHECNPAF_2530044 [Rhizobium etli CNPAF512]
MSISRGPASGRRSIATADLHQANSALPNGSLSPPRLPLSRGFANSGS